MYISNIKVFIPPSMKYLDIRQTYLVHMCGLPSAFNELVYKLDEERISEHEALKIEHAALQNDFTAVHGDHTYLAKEHQDLEAKYQMIQSALDESNQSKCYK